jgi:hypothetical protein
VKIPYVKHRKELKRIIDIRLSLQARPSFISEKIQITTGDLMVSFKLDAQARVQGSEEQERYPIVAKVKGTGRNGGLSIQVSSEGPISIAPITVVPDLRSAAELLNVAAIVDALTRLSEGVKMEVASSGAPFSIALGRIPVDLTISVTSPAAETVFKVEIKGTVGEK